MNQSNSDPDPESTDEREEEHEIKHFLLDKRGDCIDNFMTYNVSGFKHRPSYEEIPQQQDNSNEQLEITIIMIQSATNESSNTTEEDSSSSAVESHPKHGRGSLVQQVARRVDAHLRRSGVSLRRDDAADHGHHTTQPMVQSHTSNCGTHYIKPRRQSCA
jgi:hypothetical protein